MDSDKIAIEYKGLDIYSLKAELDKQEAILDYLSEHGTNDERVNSKVIYLRNRIRNNEV